MWMIFYDDGTTFSDKDGAPNEAPATGVIVVLQNDADGKNVLYIQKDYYVFGWRAPNEWVFTEFAGWMDYMYNYRGKDKAVIFGRWTSNENFEKIWQEANRVWRELADGE